ncbi:MAG: hypothetical protein H6732_17755, partial [Alphaproteobacteria bacterium]|nr:hypothetical protein [Alphaproteobacteria bacterium]
MHRSMGRWLVVMAALASCDAVDGEKDPDTATDTTDTDAVDSGDTLPTGD